MDYYKGIYRDIVTGVLAPGEKLTLAKLKKSYNCGQCPLREALSRLIETGLVENVLNKGFRVAKISKNEIEELFEAITLLDTLALEESLEKGNDEWEIKIMASLHNLSTIETGKISFDYYHWSSCNADFHQTILSACPNQALLDIRNKLYKKIERYKILTLKEDRRKLKNSNTEHHALVNSIIKRNVAEALSLLNEHYENGLKSCLSFFEDKNDNSAFFEKK